MYRFYLHAGSANHGCEAIVRSSINILDSQVELWSRVPNLDTKYGIDKICKISNDDRKIIKRNSLKWILSVIQTKLTGKIDLSIKYQYSNLISSTNKSDICLSIGGDNYCYPGTDVLAAINRNIKKKGAKTVLWGCSVEPSLMKNKSIKADLKSFDLITARESISYEALKEINCNVVLVSDPAFTLPKIDLPLPNEWKEGKMIGINASPLIIENGKNAETVYEAYKLLIEYIIKETEYNVALIPHVMADGNNDYEVLKKLYNDTEDKDRLVLIEDHNCMELKGYISRCAFFIGARTHATIAAYSTCVPTLVLGYSVKSRGIAKDLFGDYQNYVLPVQDMNNSRELLDSFKWIMKHEIDIRNHLREVMPDYISKAYLAKDALEKLK
ncbi:polysaccharide pyruvyl transferase family protein [Catenibacterium mitsuokai]|uniref:polysaccharide pyruvyl transferase family protein n=1 Tax=Catenibacterium mitsuokai TaxID=100886 RepID=UPI003D046A9E